MSDIILEILRALLASATFTFLWISGKKAGLRGEKGWTSILAGTGLILFGIFIDITDNLPYFDRFVILGNTPYQSFLEKIIGYLFGFIVLTMGLWKWIPNIIERKRAEEALRESEARYRAVVEDQTEYIVRWLPDGTRTFTNKAYCKYFGLSSTASIGSSIYPFIQEEDRDTVRRKIKTLTPENPVLVDEHRVTLADGTIRWNRWTDRAIFDNEGRLIEVQSVGRDVTERKEAEEALQRSKAELEERNESLHVINMISQKLHRSLDLQTIADEAVRSLSQHSRSPKVAFLLVNHEKNELELVSHLGFSKETLKAGSRLPLIGSLSGITLSEKRVLTSDDMKHDDRLELTVRDALLNQELQSVVSVPLLFQDEALGVVNLILAEHEAIDGQDSDTLLSIGKTIGLAIVNARHVARIHTEVDVRTSAEEALRRSESQLRALASRLQEVEEVERKALARELHDRVGQNLTGLNINLNIIQNQLYGEPLKHVTARLDDSMNLVEETTAHIRDVMAELRPEVLDDYGLIPALEWYVDRFAERTGLAAVVEGGDLSVRMPETVESALFRIAQEALTNVAKHAEARKVTLIFEETEGLFRLTISDDGKGFDMTALKSSRNSKGWGVLTMQERAQALDGKVRVDTAPGKGTRVVIEVKN